jgi:hypothetical protein
MKTIVLSNLTDAFLPSSIALLIFVCCARNNSKSLCGSPEGRHVIHHGENPTPACGLWDRLRLLSSTACITYIKEWLSQC